MICLRCNQTLELSEAVHGMHAICFGNVFGVKREHDFTDLFERQDRTGPRKANDTTFRRFNSSFFHGKYRKYSATLGEKNYILKMQQPECVELPPTEELSNRIADELGLEIPFHQLILYQNSVPTFVSRNFMDDYSAATLDHIYKFIQNDAEYDCEKLIQIIQTETGKLSEVYRFVEICLFDALIGNSDRHGRNLAFVTRSGGVRELSPFYDNPSYIGIADEITLGSDLQPRGLIYTSSNQEPILRDYIQEFKKLNLAPAVQRFSRKAKARSKKIIEMIQTAPLLSDKRRQAFTALFQKRMMEFDNE